MVCKVNRPSNNMYSSIFVNIPVGIIVGTNAAEIPEVPGRGS